MLHSWKKLISLTEHKRFIIKEVRIPEDEIDITGEFELPPMARLSMEDQIFTAAFIKTHGSIKQMESIFSISYPTVKNRLNAIGRQLDIVDVEVQINQPARSVLERLSSGEISVEDALKEMQ